MAGAARRRVAASTRRARTRRRREARRDTDRCRAMRVAGARDDPHVAPVRADRAADAAGRAAVRSRRAGRHRRRRGGGVVAVRVLGGRLATPGTSRGRSPPASTSRRRDRRWQRRADRRVPEHAAGEGHAARLRARGDADRRRSGVPRDSWQASVDEFAGAPGEQRRVAERRARGRVAARRCGGGGRSDDRRRRPGRRRPSRRSWSRYKGKTWTIAQDDDGVIERGAAKPPWQTRSEYSRCSARCTCPSRRRWCARREPARSAGMPEMNMFDIDATGSLHGQVAFPVPGIGVDRSRDRLDRRHRARGAARHVARARLHRGLCGERAAHVGVPATAGSARPDPVGRRRSRAMRSSCSTTAIRSRSCQSCRRLLRRPARREAAVGKPDTVSPRASTATRLGTPAALAVGHDEHDEEPPRRHRLRLSLAAGCVKQDASARRRSSRAIPTADQVSDQAARAAQRARSVELADYYVVTRDVTRTFNGGSAWVLVLIHTIVQYPVTSVSGDTLHVGPVERRRSTPPSTSSTSPRTPTARTTTSLSGRPKTRPRTRRSRT